MRSVLMTLLVGHQEEHPFCKNLSDGLGVLICLNRGADCLHIWSDATAIAKPHHLLPHLCPDWFYLSGTHLARLSWKRGQSTAIWLFSSNQMYLAMLCHGKHVTFSVLDYDLCLKLSVTMYFINTF